jgi:hypothetical protein
MGRPRGKNGDGRVLKTAAAAAVGGAMGALGAGIAVSAGVKPSTAAIATLAIGGVGAYALKGNARTAMIGATAMGAGQLALGYYIQRKAAQDARSSEEVPKPEGVIDTTAASAAALPVAKNSAPTPTTAALPGASSTGAATSPPAEMPRRQGYDDGDGDDYDDPRNVGVLPEYDGDGVDDEM